MLGAAGVASGRGRALIAAAVAVGACGGGPARLTLPRDAQVLARGSLAYAVAFAGGGRVVSIELEERFALVVRGPDGRVAARHDLGPPERDLGALAVDREVAWLGGADRQVRGLALDGGAVLATWPTGAVVTSLAAGDGRLLIGDAEGAVCLRRLDDGALLQCAQLGDAPIDELVAIGPVVVASTGGRRLGLSVPALALVTPPADPRGVVRRGRDLWIDGVHALRLGSVVKAVAVDPRGRVAVAGYVTRLDDPSLLIVPRRSPRSRAPAHPSQSHGRPRSRVR